MKYYKVSFQIGEFWHSNIAYAESESVVREHYTKKYSACTVTPANEYDLKEAREKGKPFVMLGGEN